MDREVVTYGDKGEKEREREREREREHTINITYVSQVLPEKFTKSYTLASTAKTYNF